jgi:ABC-type dipeptide/oligopeptide/nickel transport system ATPase component
MWFLEDEKFRNWKHNALSEFLWVTGKHGCGKSYLASLAVNDLEATKVENGNTAIAYVYCNRREESACYRGQTLASTATKSVKLEPI